MKKEGTHELEFDGVKPANRPGRPGACYALSSNWSIGPLLARGALTAPMLGEPTDVPFLDGFERGIPLSKGPIPTNWVAELRASRRNISPIAVRVASAGAVRRSRGSCRAVCLDEVDALVFETEKDAKHLRSNSFADYDLERLDLPHVIDPSVFKGDPREWGTSSKITQALPGVSLRFADSRTAICATLLHVAPGTPDWMEAFDTVWTGESNSGPPSTWLRAILAGFEPEEASAQSLEGGLLSSVSSLLATSYPLHAGWPASEVLDQILAQVGRRVRPDVLKAEQEVLSVWATRCREIIDARRELPSMLDDRRIVLRAIMLLMVRSEVEPLLQIGSQDGVPPEMRVGANVRALAACLAATRTGLRACPSIIKHEFSSPRPGDLLRAHGRRFLEWAGAIPAQGSRTPKKKLKVARRSIRPLVGEWVLSRGSCEFARKSIEHDPALVQVESMARQSGYVFAEHESGLLSTVVTTPHGPPQTVFMSLQRQHPLAPTSVRFWSVVKDLSLKRPSTGTKLSRALVNKLPKSYLIDLLERNGSSGMSCRFSLSSELGALIVLVDQLTSSLDEQELRQHIDHVAAAAAALA